MKVCVLGASGNVGRRVAARALAEGHTVTAVLREASRLPPALADRVEVRVADHACPRALAEAIDGHDAAVGTAGYLTDPGYIELVDRVVEAAETSLGRGGRFWMMAGAALLDVPGTGRMTLSYPKVPPMYRAHRINYDRVRRTVLDWSVLCPGPMTDAPDGEPTRGLTLSAETWPVRRWPLARLLPDIVTSLNFARSVPRMTIFYEDAARVIVDHLATKGAYSGRRVGIALPGNATHRKQP
ncbi:MAG: SDR family oxidoreductase [Methylorubrum populi]